MEAAVSLFAAWRARSPALLAFGGDSAIELFSAVQDVAPISGKPVHSPLDAIGSVLRVSEPANSVDSNGQIPFLCEIEESRK
jgi:hypothetical protein